MISIHVTRVDGSGVYGHSTRCCDESGCAGHEMFFGSDPTGEITSGDVIEVEGDDAQAEQD